MSDTALAAHDPIRRRVHLMLEQYAQRLILAAENYETSGEAQRTEIILALLDRCEALDANVVFIRLLERFGQQLQRECHLRQAEALFAAVLAQDTLTDAQRVAFTDLRVRVLVQLGERELAERTLTAAWPAASTPALKAKFYNRQGYLWVEYEAFADAQQAFQTGLVHAESCGDRAMTSTLHNNLGELYYRTEDNPTALAHFAKAIALAQDLDQPFLLALAEGGLAMTLDASGEFEEAIAHHERARRCYQASADRFGEVRIDLNLAYNAFLRTDYAAMQSLAASALIKAKRLGDIERTALAYHRLGQAHSGLRHYETALEYYQTALDLRIIIGKPTYVRTTIQNLARLMEFLAEDAEFPAADKLKLHRIALDMRKAAESAIPAAFT